MGASAHSPFTAMVVVAAMRWGSGGPTELRREAEKDPIAKAIRRGLRAPLETNCGLAHDVAIITCARESWFIQVYVISDYDSCRTSKQFAKKLKNSF